MAEGGFFETEAGRSDLLVRSKPGVDGAAPSGNALAALAMMRLGGHLDRQDFQRCAERTLACFAARVQQMPSAHLAMLSALDRFHRGPMEIVLAGEPVHATTQAMLRIVRKAYLPNASITLVVADPSLPLHRERITRDGTPVAYVCTKRTCSDPIPSEELLAVRLSEK
jgi:hypothetical protein